MNSADSVTKIVTQYFAAVTREPFTFKGKRYEPKDLRVSPGIFTRRMTCHAGCGGCCRLITVDFLPDEARHERTHDHAASRTVQFNGCDVTVISDRQQGNDGLFCRYLDDNARCSIHDAHPLSCDFETLRFSLYSKPASPNQFTHRPFGRGWAMLRIDGERGALCEWRDDECDPEWVADVVRRLRRLEAWTDHFGIETCIPEIIDYVETGPHKEPLLIENSRHSEAPSAA